MVGCCAWYLDLNDQFFHFHNIQPTCVVNSQEQIFEANKYLNHGFMVTGTTSDLTTTHETSYYTLKYQCDDQLDGSVYKSTYYQA